MFLLFQIQETGNQTKVNFICPRTVFVLPLLLSALGMKQEWQNKSPQIVEGGKALYFPICKIVQIQPNQDWIRLPSREALFIRKELSQNLLRSYFGLQHTVECSDWASDQLFMPKYFLMITSDAHKSLLTSPSAELLALNRLKNGFWPLYKRTKNINRINPGDFLIIYSGGKRENGMSFIGSARVAQLLESRGRGTKLLIDSHYSSYTTDPEKYLKLSECKVFPKYKSIKGLKDRLDFIKKGDSKKWGCYLQGGCLSLTQHDFSLLSKK